MVCEKVCFWGLIGVLTWLATLGDFKTNGTDDKDVFQRWMGYWIDSWRNRGFLGDKLSLNLRRANKKLYLFNFFSFIANTQNSFSWVGV